MTDRLLFAGHRPPLPLTNGSRIRTHRLLTGLSRSFEVTFLTFEHHPRSPDGGLDRDELEQVLPRIEIVTVPGRGPGKRLGQARSLLSTPSWSFGRYRLARFEQALARTVARTRPAIVHLDDLGVGQLGPTTAPLTVFAPHNIEHRIVKQTAQTASGIRRAFASIEWRKLQREEQRVWREMPLCLAVSEVDAGAMVEGGAQRVELCPNGTDAVARLPPPHRRPDEPLRLLFVGSADYQPYERGIAWFVREALPTLQELVPTTFDVVGTPPRRQISAPGVKYVGRVPEVAEWYERSHAVVVPIFEASGTRLKIVEAMAHGRPVVSTSPGALGLPVSPGVHYLEADDARAFVHSLVDIAHQCEQGGGRMARMLDEASDAVTPLLWPRIVERLVALYRSELAERVTDRPAR